MKTSKMQKTSLQIPDWVNAWLNVQYNGYSRSEVMRLVLLNHIATYDPGMRAMVVDLQIAAMQFDEMLKEGPTK